MFKVSTIAEKMNEKLKKRMRRNGLLMQISNLEHVTRKYSVVSGKSKKSSIILM